MLETIWFLLWGLLWGIYFILDGFDLGMGTIQPFIAADETERRIMNASVGPLWNGNEVWLLTAGGVTFAAFPGTYAAMFSGLYTALFLLLFAIIIRGMALELRGAVDSDAWRKAWDIVFFLGSFLPALLLGVAFANIFKGIALDANGVNQEGLFHLLNPYGLAGGVLFVLMFVTHGALWLTIKSQGALQDKAMRLAARCWPILVIWTVLFLVYTAIATRLFGNYYNNPALFIVPLLAVVGLIGMRVYLGAGRHWMAWAASSLYIFCVAFFGVIGMFPALLPSSLNPAWSKTIYNSASSPLTLKIMLVVALIFVPIVLAYQAWSYKTFSHKVTEADLDHY